MHGGACFSRVLIDRDAPSRAMVARHVSHADRTLPGLSDPRSGKRFRRGVGTERHWVCNFRGNEPVITAAEHPRVLLGKMIERNYEDYGRLRGCLDWSVQQTCASWIAKHERVRLKDLNPNVFAGDIRQSAFLRIPRMLIRIAL